MREQNNGSQKNGDSSHRNESSQSAGLEPSNPPSRTPDRLAEELEYYRNFLEQLLGLVRDGDQEDVNRMISIIRSDASPQEILTALSENTADNAQTVQRDIGRSNHNQN
ncbi:hypothetical protein BO78DRAFT_217720 [Aspergillus sclerotiicarbonarius CBS 121057]|uniref:Uncharacterized protein n=1 Tax=Aspergillus sclerotiicarbonarius (strain CBS 121057 / IBT 28362) TaxID=1448318 RepID=A0A319F9N4_ASPSB|nr:hypothetical protein BO78DRAFT_217720 [Aspergillus sclerotiicarbonarius CBS 121057]